MMWNYLKSGPVEDVVVDVLKAGPSQLPPDVKAIIAARLFQYPTGSLCYVVANGGDNLITNLTVFQGGPMPPPPPPSNASAPTGEPDAPAAI